MKFPTPAISRQAIEIHGCNCDACCHLTPLARRRVARIKARLTKRTPDKAKAAAFPNSVAVYRVSKKKSLANPPCG
jgi:hypothetical protein